MEQPIYFFLSWVAEGSQLSGLMQSHTHAVIAALLVLALLCCLFGFYCYRGVVSGLVLCALILISRILLRPAWGALEAVTFCSVVGVAAAFLAFRWYRLGAVALCAVIAGSWMWQLLWHDPLEFPWWILAILLAAAAAGVLTFFFPLWGVCAFPALWGGLTLAQEGWRLLPQFPRLDTPSALLLGLALGGAGFALQLLLFRRQKLFPRIMPKQLEYRLQKRRQREGAAA